MDPVAGGGGTPRRPDPAAVPARPRWVIGSRDLGRTRPTLVREPGTPDAGRPTAAAERPDLAVAVTAGPHDEAGHVQTARLRGTVADAASDPRADGTTAALDGGSARTPWTAPGVSGTQ